MKSLRLHALTWDADGSRHRIEIPETGLCVVAIDEAAAAALAEVVLGMRPPVGGTIRIDGRDVTGRPAGERGIALVPPGGALLPHLTVEKNVAYGMSRADREHVGDRIRDLRLEGIRRLRPHELSPVQRLQVAVARALCAGGRPSAIVIEDRAGQVPCRW